MSQWYCSVGWLDHKLKKLLKTEAKMEIKKIENLDDLQGVQPIYLNCILMANNEIIFCGKSLGVLTEEQIKKWAFIDKGA